MSISPSKDFVKRVMPYVLAWSTLDHDDPDKPLNPDMEAAITDIIGAEGELRDRRREQWHRAAAYEMAFHAQYGTSYGAIKDLSKKWGIGADTISLYIDCAKMVSDELYTPEVSSILYYSMVRYERKNPGKGAALLQSVMESGEGAREAHGKLRKARGLPDWEIITQRELSYNSLSYWALFSADGKGLRVQIDLPGITELAEGDYEVTLRRKA